MVGSGDDEGFGMVLAEAISYGIYCISSDCQCGPNDIINNLNGELYKSGNILELSKKLQLIIDECKIRDHHAIKNSIAFLYEDNFLLRITKALSPPSRLENVMKVKPDALLFGEHLFCKRFIPCF
ncbi:glycosyltransferase [Photorhabdus antumapuensis]|uniref:glycosyltransferase n=1 Tax=Photorhabdus antumapuensis TaxID=2862867 RepID=UPI001CEDD6FB|nr:glycosyltransferase [Photorhabdus antumapuensis]